MMFARGKWGVSLGPQLAPGTHETVLQDRKSKFAEGRAMMSSYDDEFQAEPAPAAARVGADLRAARERLGWTLPAIAGHLRIRLPFLEAIEDGRTGDLPGNAYAVGFIRTYAQALGLDPDEIARRFRAEAAEANRKTELNFPAPVPERGVPAGAIVLVGALLAIGAYAGWYKMSGNSHPTADLVPSVPERLAPLAEKVAPPPAPVPTQKAATANIEPPPPPVPSIAPSSAAAAVAPGGYAPAAPAAAATSGTAATATANPAPVPFPPPVEAARIDGPRIVLRAKADAWIQVRDKGGQVLLNRVLRAGETWQVPAKPSLLLTTGNAAGTELVVDGLTTASLGADGAVRRDLPLDADAIKEGKLAPSVAAFPTAPATKKQ
jgi:cytoskeleton protein RodZ